MNFDNISSELIMQIIVYANVFVMGVLVVIAFKHAITHFRIKNGQEPSDGKTHIISNNQPLKLPPAIKEKMLEDSEEHFQIVLDKSTASLEKDLKSITNKLTDQLDKVGSKIIMAEMKRYQQDLEAMRKQAESIIEAAQRDIVSHQADLKDQFAKKQTELEAELKQEIADEKQELIKHIDNNLSDAVASFLNEAMKYEIDLGAQTPYLIKVLEEHKAELIKEMMDEA